MQRRAGGSRRPGLVGQQLRETGKEAEKPEAGGGREDTAPGNQGQEHEMPDSP